MSREVFNSVHAFFEFLVAEFVKVYKLPLKLCMKVQNFFDTDVIHLLVTSCLQLQLLPQESVFNGHNSTKKKLRPFVLLVSSVLAKTATESLGYSKVCPANEQNCSHLALLPFEYCRQHAKHD